MKICNHIVGNIADPKWSTLCRKSDIDYIDLDQWTAQKSRFVVRGRGGKEYAIALRRHTPIKDGDILYAEAGRIVAIRLKLSQIMTLDLSDITLLTPTEIISLAVEIGHALGNQHWPAVVKENKIYVPMTVDRKVMQSVISTHHFPFVSYSFTPAEELLPHLSPNEVRRLLGSAEQHRHSHE